MPQHDVAFEERTWQSRPVTAGERHPTRKDRYKIIVRSLLLAGIATFSAANVLCAANSYGTPAPAATTPGTADGVPEALQGPAWEQITAQVEADRHRVRELDGKWRAHTPKQSYSTTFGSLGPDLEVRGNKQAHAVGFRFRNARVDGQAIETQAPERVAIGNRMNYRRGSLTEWYVNRPEGLEQGFTVDDGPVGETLSIELAVSSDLTASLEDNALLLSDNDRLVLRYAGLKAWDASGQTLAARLALDDHRVSLNVDIEGASYPITVDPVMFSEVAKLTPDSSPGSFGHPGDLAGRSASIDGGRVLIGAAGSFDDDSPYNEEAFIFERDAGSGDWAFVARLAPNDTNNTSWFGSSVSLSGDRALVGATWDDENGHRSGSAYVFDFDGTQWSETQKLLPTEPAENEQFGIAVALLGNRALIGARGGNCAYVFDFDGTTWIETEKLQPGQDRDNGFGFPVTLDGNRALVGAAFDNENGDNSGSAYIFEFNGAVWNQADRLKPTDGDASDYFGMSTSLSGDLALVGAPWDDDSGPRSGSAYIFEYDGTGWHETAKLLPSDSAEHDQFGFAVGLSGTRALVGTDSGESSYVFNFDGNSWIETAKLEPADGSGVEGFGTAVDLSGDHALVGAPWNDSHGAASGSAYVFDFGSQGWSEADNLLAPGDEARSDLLGQSVSLSGDRVLIGAFGDEDNGPFAGSAYVFEFSGGEWNKTAKLLPADSAAVDHFGYAVSLLGDRALIGAPRDDDNGPSSGSAYVFEFDGGVWSETTKLLAEDGDEQDRFGHAVSLSGDRALVGAFGDSSNGFESGSAYVFEFENESWNETTKLLPDDGTEEDRFGFAVSLSDDRALVGAPGPLHVFGSTTPGSAYVFDFNGTLWSEASKLEASDGDIWDEFGRSLSLAGDHALIGAPESDGSNSRSGSAYLFSFSGNEWNEDFKLIPGDESTGQRFGSAVSLSNNRALVGATNGGSHDGTFRPGTAYVFKFDSTGWLEVDKLLPEEGGGAFGTSVSLSGNHAIIGTPGDSVVAPDAGAAFSYMVTNIFSDSFGD